MVLIDDETIKKILERVESVIVIDEEKKKVYPGMRADLDKVKAVAHPLRHRMIELLAEKPMYLSEIARELGTNEQHAFYHLNLLRKAGLVTEDKEKTRPGAKYYRVTEKALVYLPEAIEGQHTPLKIYNFLEVPPLLEGFVEDGKIKCRVVVGAPFPHGKWDRGARSGHLAGEVCLVLGRYGEPQGRVTYWDVELDEEDKKDNLIIISGMHVNTLQEEVNEHLPIRFSQTESKIISTITGREYTDPECGFVCLAPNPFHEKNKVLVIAGLSSPGTRAAVFAFRHHLDRISKGNMNKPGVIASVVRGIEAKGEITKVVFIE